MSLATTRVANEQKKRLEEEKLKKILLDIFYVVVIIIIAAIICYFRLKVQYLPERGPGFDGLAFLSNGLKMAGISNYFEIARPPLLPLLLSLFFRMGLINETIAYLIDAFFFTIGAIGLYLIIKDRFPRILGVLAALIFMSIPEMVANVGFVGTDVMAISVSIWLIYFTLLTKNSPRMIIVVFLTLALAFLARYTAALMVFPVLFYLLVKINPMKYIRYYAFGIATFFAIIIGDIIYYSVVLGDEVLSQFLSPLMTASLTEKVVGVQLTAQEVSKFFFVINMPDFFSAAGKGPMGLVIALIFAAGFLILGKDLIKARKKSLLATNLTLVLLSIFIFLLVFSSINFIFINVIFLVAFSVIFPTMFDLNKARLLDILFFIWFVIFFNYHTHQFAKTNRYFITMAPAAAYFIVIAVNEILLFAKNITKQFGVYGATFRYIFSVLLVTCLFFLFGFSAYQSERHIAKLKWGINENIKEASDWVRPRLKADSKVYADYFVGVAWQLRKPIEIMPTYVDPRAYYHEIEKTNPDYFISIYVPMKDTPYFKVVKHFKGVYIYKKTGKPFVRHKPSFYFIGRDLVNYIEDLLDYKYYLIRKKSNFADDPGRSINTRYVDEYKLSELNKYPVLMLYNFKWHSLKKTEDLLRQYVKNGGTLIVDASANIGKVTYDFNNSAFLGVMIKRKTLPRKPKIKINAKTLKYDFAPHKNINFKNFGPFYDELKMPWRGATYRKVAGYSDNFEPLVSLEGNPLLGLQRIGKGKVIWLGYNYFFHSYFYKKKDEKRFIKNIFDYAIEDSAMNSKSKL